MRPPTSITKALSASTMRCVSCDTAMSTATEVPCIGKESTPCPCGPQSLITHRGEAPPRSVSRRMKARTPSAPAAAGITAWYWVKPRGP